MTEDALEKELYEKHFRVAIFGSARIEKGDETRERIYELAKRIAAEGIDIVTGGGPGMMHAANAGHEEGRKDGDVHSLGLNIKLPHEQFANRHLDIEKEFEHFSERLDNFMVLSNAVVVAPGGIGTLLEFFYTWQLTQVRHICTIPIILYGEMWEGLLDWIDAWPLAKELMDSSDLDNVIMARDIEDVMNIIKEFHAFYKEGRAESCSNYKRYILKR